MQPVLFAGGQVLWLSALPASFFWQCTRFLLIYSQKWTQKAFDVTDLVARRLKRKCLLEAEVKAQTSLRFEVLYVS